MSKKHKRLLDGLPVVDAVNDISIIVTKADIQNSKKKNPDECAAAQAGKRELHREVKVFMSRMYVKDVKNKQWIRFLTPHNVSREITSFDRGSSFEPGEYTFKAASAGQKLGTYHGKSTKKREGKRKIHITQNVRVRANY